MRNEGFLINHVKTTLSLLSELIWIKGDDKDIVACLKERMKVGCIISTQHSVLTYGISREFVLDDLSSALFEVRPCSRKKPGR
jgi:hypothetical protein